MYKDKPEPLPQDWREWQEFMNGYRDPKTYDAWRKEYAGEFNDMAREWFGGSGNGSRQCGNRKEGGTYATCGLSPYGKPLEHFIVCSPVAIKAEDYNLANVGVKLVDIEEVCLTCKGEKPKKSVKAKYFEVCKACDGTGKETVTHIFDIVGQEYYPNVADFLEESRRMGVSRRLELEDRRQYARLSARSRIMLLHHRAVINNPKDRLFEMGQYEFIRYARAACPKENVSHSYETLTYKLSQWAIKAESPGCSALYWNMIEGGNPIPESEPVPQGGQTPKSHKPLEIPSHGFVERELACGKYRGYGLPEGYTPDYSLGIFAVFPLTEIEVIDPDGSYEDRVERAGAARVDVEAVEC